MYNKFFGVIVQLEERNIIYIVLLCVFLVIIFVFGVTSVVFYFKNKKNVKHKHNLQKQIVKLQQETNNKLYEMNFPNDSELGKLIKFNENLKKELTKSVSDYEVLNNKLKMHCEKENIKLATIANISVEDAKKKIMENLELSLKKQKAKMIREVELITKQEILDKTNQLIVESFESINDDFITAKTSFSIKLDDDTIKGKIIGKDGRNKKTFEKVTGTDIVIEKEPEITISCYNPIRREIAKNVLEKLLLNKNIEPSRIEKYYEQEVATMEEKVIAIGKDAVENKLNIFDLNPSLYKFIGRLYFRTSYGQNILNHSLECAMIATNIARLLKVDEKKAKLAAFFHDIGKSIDFEMNNDHVEAGLKLGKDFQLDDYILNTIESHHEKVDCNNIFAYIAKIVDKISASKPGARFISFEEYIKRINTIEDICNGFKGVKNSYAIKAGKQVRVIIDPKLIDDDEIIILANQIKERLENNTEVNRHPIEIVVIRENRIKTKTNSLLIENE